MLSLARRPLSAAVPSGNLLGIHLFKCPDTVGIVAKLSECIASRGGNIHSVDVFVPDDKPVFYSRSEFTYNPRLWPRHELHNDFLNLSHCFNAQTSTVRVPDLDPKYNISILASKQDHCLFDLLHRWQEGRLPVHINCVISNHDRPQDNHVRRFLQRHGIPYHYLPTAPGNKREQEILELIQGTDFVVLARYMQILSESFLKAYGKDIINIHHGLLPSFKGGNPSRQAFSAGVKLIGATSHFVTEELDAGPIIEQMVERVSHRDTLKSFVVKSENLEKQCLAEAIKSYCELRVLPYELKKTVNALRQQRFVREVTIQFNLCNEPWLKYSISIVADKGLKKSLYTSARLKKGEVVYLETHFDSGEKAPIVGSSSNASEAEAEKHQSSSHHSHNGDRRVVEHELRDVFRWYFWKKAMPESAMRSIGIPLTGNQLEVFLLCW